MSTDIQPSFAAISRDCEHAPMQILPRSEYPTVACIIPSYNEAENLARLVPMIDATLQPLSSHYYIIVVDDGSSDGTSATAVALARQYPVRLLQLSRNFGKESAITAGLDHVDTDVVILMDADCQHPVELLPVFLKHWKDGYDMIYGVISDRGNESLLKRKATGWFYSLLSRTASIPIIPNAGDFRLFDRQVVTALKILGERTRFMKGLYSWVGFRSIGVPYQPAPRFAGRSQFPMLQLYRLAVTGLTSFSDIPLRIWSGVGVLVSLCSIAFGLFIWIRTLVYGVDLPGWATLTVSTTLLGGIQLISIGILGEYIGRIFTEVKGRPTYLVRYRHGFQPKHDE
ncbi:MAG: glycosyltransferase family 2 protein [Paucimonas sp.]|nr:glycosyltransferase family 2 protein [Paucimonas sp.]